MPKPISKFFEELGFPLRNIRWSWGARSGQAVLLRTWADEFSAKERAVVVLREAAGYQANESYGLDERINHVKAIWEGNIAAYTVIATAKHEKLFPREIKEYRDDKVFAIRGLVERDDGSIVALLSDMVLVDDLAAHAKSHMTAQVHGQFPADQHSETGISTGNLRSKLPQMRGWLIELAQQSATATYGEMMDRYGIIFFQLRTALSQLGHQCSDAGEPILTALIVDKETGHCSQGIRDEFGVEDDDEERRRCFRHWSLATSEATAKVRAFDRKFARFTSVEVRPDQRAFREAVYKACSGRCVVSGCSVPEAVEAAHLQGRRWRDGHNTATDGLLLRRDLHALYDSGLLSIAGDGIVSLSPESWDDYTSYHGVRITGKLD
jgi:hypothetical protein